MHISGATHTCFAAIVQYLDIHTRTHARTHTHQMDIIFFLTPAVHMPVVSMCAWVSTFFCCCCRGNFEYCGLTVKRVIHPLVDLPSVLALKTNNLSLDWVYSCLDSGRKTGRLKKIRPLAALVLIFSLHYLHKCCVPCALSGNHLAVTLWHTRTWKIEGKGGKKWKKRMSVSHLNEWKGEKEKK